MAELPAHGSGRLDSWKAIATYLNRDERTVRRWERQLGLPIRRVPGGRGTSVFAYTSEIEAWLKATPPPASPPTSARSAWRVPTVVVGCGLLAVGVAWRVADSTAYAPPVRVEVTTSGLVAHDAVDAEQWRYAFPAEERVFLPDDPPTAVVDGGSPAVFAATAFRLRRSDEAVQGGQLLWLTPRGALERTFAFDDRVSFGAGDYGAPWAITDFQLDERTGLRRVAVSAHHYTWWPSLVTILDDGWQRRGTFVNAGWIDSVYWLSRDRLLVLGFSDALDGGMAAILDVDDLDGQSPAPADSPFFCASCGTGRPVRYIVMPRSEVNRASSSRFNRARLQPIGEHFLVRTIEVPQGVGDAADALYEFSPSLDLISASFSARYWEIHRTLETQGKITHSREQCPDRDGPGEIQVWEPATGWRTESAAT